MQNQLSFTAETDASEAAAASSLRAELVDPAVTVAFMLAGNAHVTFQSRRTGTRFTYRVQAAHGEGAFRASGVSHFVAVLTGPDHYEYLGCIFDRKMYSHGRKSRISPNAQSNFAFMWVWKHLFAGKMHPELGVWHEGRCSVCSRRLSTPESIRTGIGPVCSARLGR